MIEFFSTIADKLDQGFFNLEQLEICYHIYSKWSPILEVDFSETDSDEEGEDEEDEERRKILDDKNSRSI